MYELEFKQQIIKYKVIKSNRKTITILIHPTKEVIVRAPKYVSEDTLKKLVESKANWILKKLSEMPEINDISNQKNYKDGDKILYRGKEYILKEIKTTTVSKSIIMLNANEVCVLKKMNEKKETHDLLIEWYKERAKDLVQERINYYMPLINRPIGDIRIKSQRKRWGSCSSKGNLNFNWRIILMPDEMFDYIIVHEMCHLKYLDHSKYFWKCVEMILPDYKEREKWIKENTFKLDV